MTRIACGNCGLSFDCKTSRFNRAQKIGAKLYCGKVCAGLARSYTVDEKKEAKRLYDIEYRAKNLDRIKQAKSDHYESNRPKILEQMAEYRKVRMPAHVEYCRRPEYRAYKHEYDKARNEAEYAEFAESWRLLQDLEREIRSRASSYEVRVQQGYYTRNAQKRRRELWLLKQRT